MAAGQILLTGGVTNSRRRLRDLTFEAGVVEQDGHEVFMEPLSPDEQTRRDQKFVRKALIGDLNCGKFAGMQRFL